MNFEKVMMRCYYGTMCSFLGGFVIHYDVPEFIGTFLFRVSLALAIATFVVMFFLAKTEIGKSYAVRNTILAIIFSFVAIGFVLWPHLVRSEVRKKRASNQE